jgi:DNA-directed RNA polymerase beta subunit
MTDKGTFIINGAERVVKEFVGGAGKLMYQEV